MGAFFVGDGALDVPLIKLFLFCRNLTPRFFLHFNVNKIFIIKTLGKISAVWYNRRYINEFGKAGLINESCCYGYR